jgi:hypothetical protein
LFLLLLVFEQDLATRISGEVSREGNGGHSDQEEWNTFNTYKIVLPDIPDSMIQLKINKDLFPLMEGQSSGIILPNWAKDKAIKEIVFQRFANKKQDIVIQLENPISHKLALTLISKEGNGYIVNTILDEEIQILSFDRFKPKSCKLLLFLLILGFLLIPFLVFIIWLWLKSHPEKKVTNVLTVHTPIL